MPKEGHVSITVPQEFYDRIDKFNDRHGLIFSSKQAALQRAWEHYENTHSHNNGATIEINGRRIGEGHPIYMVAEIGINHNGDMNMCKQLIDMAVEAGCDAVKFQKRTVDEAYSPKDLAKPRNVPIKIIKRALERGAFEKEDEERIRKEIEKTKNSPEVTVTNRDQKNMLEFGEKGYSEIDRHCKEKGITWFASPWDLKSIEFLERFDVPCYKIASACLTHREMLEKIKQTGKPIILSTGMSNHDQIKKAVKLLGQENLILLACTSTYPTLNLEDQNLKTILTLKKIHNCPVGYSGHEPDIFPTLMAMTLGAHVIERHITLGRTFYGSDQVSSLEKKGLQIICHRAKQTPIILGDGVKRILDSEIPIMENLRKKDNL